MMNTIKKEFIQYCFLQSNNLNINQVFLSTSLDKDISLEFARLAIDKLGLRGVIFRMKIDPKKVNLSNPYASLIFRVVHIRQMKDENRIWQVYLKLATNQDDIQLEQLTKHLREDLQCSLNPWESLAKLILNIE
ncbi:unnamed protein product [Rotaria sp. Silwood2]|nr:unnamed protein product [Rotaria sp. Silwood2]